MVDPVPPDLGFLLKDYATAIAILITSFLGLLITWLIHRYQSKHLAERFAHEKAMKRKEAHMLLRLKAIDVHDAFWSSDAMENARRLISNEADYKKIERALESRMQRVECDTKPDEYVMLEQIDGFYAAVMRMRRLRESLSTFGCQGALKTSH